MELGDPIIDPSNPPEPDPKERLVYRVMEKSCTIGNFMEYARQLADLGLDPKSKVFFEDTQDGSYIFYVWVPPVKQKRVPGRAKVMKIKEEVAEQIDQRKKAVAAGEEVPGHVPPVKGAKKIRINKKK
jgi:hypothetical protein